MVIKLCIRQGQWRKPHGATTYGYKDICKKPFRKISERTVMYIAKLIYHNMYTVFLF